MGPTSLTACEKMLDTWTELLQPRNPSGSKGLASLFYVAIVGVVLWLLVVVSRVPGYLPDVVESWLKKLPGVG